MNRLLRPTLTAALVAGGFVATASSPAHANVEIGGVAGVHVFATDNELGVPDTSTADSEKNSALFGARVGVFFGRMFGIEGEFGVIPSEARNQVFDVWNLAYRAQVVAQFRNNDDNPQKLIPFVFVGGGAMQIVSTNLSTDIAKDTDTELFVGAGAKYRVDNGWGIRGDARILFPPSSKGTSFTEDFELLLSIYKEFGLHPVKKEPVKEGPKDSDGDGIPDNVDKCPNEPEDKDGFQDEDGCPDLDNDGDGVPDKDDKCPMQAEDKDGFQDDDGCPDPDNDGDGIPDAADKCPTEAEDKDGFQDEDGCPDPDNDNDGVLDAQDKCPDQAETKNGYQDEDGCPDEIPQKLKKFTGKVEGINFASGDAVILASSNKVLDQAAAVLSEFKDLKMEIQGHTDDQPFTPKKGAKFNNNQELSQGRADAVRDYLVKKGIDASRLTAKGYGDTVPVEDPKDLKGAKLNAARAKNRRVEFKLISNLTK